MAGQKSNNIFDSKTLNNIKRILALPCDTPPSLWLETAAPAALMAMWGFASPDPKELYHKAFGHSALCSVKGALQGGHVLAPEEESRLTRNVFRVAEWADLTLWYMFIGGLLQDFALDWTTGILQASGCDPLQKVHAGSGYDPFGASFDGGRWGTFDFFFDHGPHAPAGPPGVVLQPGERGIVAVSATAEDLGGVPVQFQSRIYVDDIQATLDHATSEPKGISDWHPNVTFAHYFNPPHSPTVSVMEWQCTYGGNLPDHELFPRGGNCFVTKY